MEGKLRPDQQLRVLRSIWGKREGYVFLPWINGGAKDKPERRSGFHESPAFKWPQDKDRILDHLRKHSQNDLYFAPNIFKGKRRVEELVLPERVLYADLDPVNPQAINERPTIAWESSPNRFQAVWIMDAENAGASKAARENQRLTVAIQADPSGWDSTQLLRVPGRPNFKFNYAEDGTNGVMGRGLLWNSGPRYTWEDFKDLPEVGAITDIDLGSDLIEDIDRHQVWSKIRLKLPGRVRELYLLRDLPEDMDRSSVMWDIARSLADAGLNSLEIVALLQPTVWNKFAGRRDEIKRLQVTAAKAISQKEPLPIEEEVKRPSNVTWLADLVSQPIPRPKWLVKDIWTQGGCGFISGAPKSYKSWMALDLAVSIATATPWLGTYEVTRAKPVLYLQEEDDLRMVVDRLKVILEGKSPQHFWGGQVTMEDGTLVWKGPIAEVPIAMHVQTGFIASDPSWHAWLDEVIASNNFSMVIIDTLGTTAGNIDTDLHGDLMNKLLKPLKILAQKHNTGVCVVHHNRKSAGMGRAGNDMLGSVALHAWVDCAVYARSRESDGTILVERESKMAQDLSFKFSVPHMYEDSKTSTRQLWQPSLGTPDDDLSGPQLDPNAGKAIARKISYMGKKPQSIDKLTQTLQMDRAKLTAQLEDAVSNGYLNSSPEGYTIPGG